MCFKSGFIGLNGLRWWHYIDHQSFPHVPDWCLAYCVTILETLDFGIKFSFWNENYNFVFHILAARIVFLIGLGPSCLTRNSGLASTQTLTLGSVFAAVLYCWIAFWKWMIAWRKNEISTCIVFAFFSFQSCFIIKRIQGTVYWGGGRRHNTVDRGGWKWVEMGRDV